MPSTGQYLYLYLVLTSAAVPDSPYLMYMKPVAVNVTQLDVLQLSIIELARQCYYIISHHKKLIDHRLL